MENDLKKKDAKQDKQKAAILELLKKTPIVRLVCERAGISRATFYRWQEEDEAFEQEVSKAMLEGRLNISDMSEYQLISLAQEKNPSAIKYWLEHNNPNYMKKNKLDQSDQAPGPSVIFLEKDED